MAEDKQKESPSMELKAEEFKVIQAQIANLNQQLSVAQAIAAKEKIRAEEMSNLATRLQADFDNFRRRNAEASKKLKEDGLVEFVEKFIPHLDTIKQAITMTPDEKVAEGLKLISRQFNELLAKFGIVEITALGEQFDPNLHNAIMQVKVKEPENVNVIVEVFQKGYRLGDRIIRHSVVKVGK